MRYPIWQRLALANRLADHVPSAKLKTTQPAPSLRTLLLSSITMTFFAANSLLARLALRSGEIDGASFTAVRIVAGAFTLVLLTSFRREGIGGARRHGSLRAALALFSYAIAFSFGYLSLDPGTGALVLFAAVQMTMLGIAFAGGERPHASEWAGLAVAFAGLVYLVSPGMTAPSPVGVSLMAVSGVAWGYYSLAARDVSSPIAATAGNFTRAIPFAAGALVVIWKIGHPHANWSGVGLAATSGAVTSGLAYSLWYVALKDLRTSIAAIVQLTVPVIAAAAGVVLLGEQLTWRLALASGAILGGVALALLGRVTAASSSGS
jgi:drug/metabolite transporter (DMT)-like permease